METSDTLLIGVRFDTATTFDRRLEGTPTFQECWDFMASELEETPDEVFVIRTLNGFIACMPLFRADYSGTEDA